MTEQRSNKEGGTPYETEAIVCFVALLFTACMLGWAWPKLSTPTLIVGAVTLAILGEILAVLYFLADPDSLRGKTQEEVAQPFRMLVAFGVAVACWFWTYTFHGLGFEPGAWLYAALAFGAMLVLGRYSFKLIAWKFLEWRHG